jgi:polyphenol oxidase
MEYDTSKLEWLDYDLLEEYPHVIGKTFLRHGGVSKAPYDSLNLSDSVGDHPDAVKVNRERVRLLLQLPKLAFAKQVHGTNIFEVTLENAQNIGQADMLCTQEEGIGLGVMHADCQAVIFYDPEHEAIGVAHAGWRALVQNFYQKAIHFFSDRFKTKAEQLLVTLSPSLCPDHAEFKNYKKELPEAFWKYQTKPFYFDLWQIAIDQLKNAKVQEENIELPRLCTYCEKKNYYSHRRDKETGRLATVAALLPRK